MAEAGVRFVEVTAGGWDHHQDLKATLEGRRESIEKPIAGLNHEKPTCNYAGREMKFTDATGGYSGEGKSWRSGDWNGSE